MHLSEALDYSINDMAKLAIHDSSDPCFLGSSHSPVTLYMWVRGHSVPVTIYGLGSDAPDVKDREVCVCGKPHTFPNGHRELIYRLHWDDRWEPCFPVWAHKSPLEALAHVASREGIDKHDSGDDH